MHMHVTKAGKNSVSGRIKGGKNGGGNTGANPNDVNGTPNPQTSDLGGMNAPADDGNMPEDEDFY